MLPASTYELSHFDVISHQLLDNATDELRKKFTEPPYSTALAISWAPREFLYRAWRTGRRSRSMKRKDQVLESPYSVPKSLDTGILNKHAHTTVTAPGLASGKHHEHDWLSVVLR